VGESNGIINSKLDESSDSVTLDVREKKQKPGSISIDLLTDVALLYADEPYILQCDVEMSLFIYFEQSFNNDFCWFLLMIGDKIWLALTQYMLSWT